MKEYFKWLIANTRIRKATFRLFWFIAYLSLAVVIVREAIIDSPWALLTFIPLGAMLYYQWKHFKNRVK